MLKKIFIVVTVLFLIIGGFFAWTFLHPKKTVENFLSQDPVFYVQTNRLSKSFNKLTGTELYKKIKSINTGLLVEKGALKADEEKNLDSVLRIIEEPSTKVFLEHFFSDQTAFVFYPFTIDMNNINDPSKFMESLNQVISSFVVVTRVSPEAKALELILKLTGLKNEDVVLSKTQYNHKVIEAIVLSKSSTTIYYFSQDDFLVLGLSSDAIKLSIDVLQGAKASLLKDAKFIKAKAKWLENADMQGYLNFGIIMGQVKQVLMKNIDSLENKDVGLDEKESAKLKQKIARSKEKFDQSLKSMDAYSWMSFSGTWDSLSKSQVSIPIDSSKISPDMASAMLCPSIENNTLKFTPKDLMAYAWVGCFKFDYYWNEIKKEIESIRQQNPGDGLQADPIKSFEGTVGLSVENDILPAFGDEFGGYLNDIKISGMFPIPELALFIRVEDKSKVEKILSKAKESPLVKVQEDQYNGTAINYFVLPLGDQIQPSFAYVGDYLLFAINREMIIEAVDVMRGSAESLVVSEAFKSVNFGLTEKNSNIQFLRLNTLLSKVKGLVEWGDSWAQGQEASRQAFRDGNNSKINELAIKLKDAATKLDDLKFNKDNVQSQIKSLSVQGLDISNQQAELSDIEEKISAKEKSMMEDNDQMEKLEEVLKDYNVADSKPQLRRVLVQELVYPLLDGLTEYETLGVRTFIDKNSIESESFMKSK